MTSIQLNHVALRCENVETMANFFIDIIGLEKGFRPPFSFPGFWLYSPENKKIPLLHLFGKDTKFNHLSPKAASDNGLFDHLAFTREDYPAFIAHLKKLDVTFDENFVPDTNVKQVFVLGPEGLVIENDIIYNK